MKKQREDPLHGLLSRVAKHFEQDDRVGQGRLRASNSGKKARYLAFDIQDTPKDDLQARTSVLFEVGNMVHDWLRDTLAESDQFEVLDRERELDTRVYVEANKVNNGVDALQEDEHGIYYPFTGHIDLRLRDKETGEIYLVDIKTVDQYSYVKTDPSNKKKQPWWRARLYTFDPLKAWLDEKFKGSYLYQIATYAESCQEEGLDFDHILFWTVNRNTGHFALGKVEFNDDQYIKLLEERDEEFRKALYAESPYDLELCWEPTDDTPDIQCQYCDYTSQCFDYDITVKSGKPKLTITNIRESLNTDD